MSETKNLRFLKTYTPEQFKSEFGASNAEVLKRNNEGKITYFLSYFDKEGVQSLPSNEKAYNAEKRLISEVVPEDSDDPENDKFMLCHAQGNSEQIVGRKAL